MNSRNCTIIVLFWHLLYSIFVFWYYFFFEGSLLVLLNPLFFLLFFFPSMPLFSLFLCHLPQKLFFNTFFSYVVSLSWLKTTTIHVPLLKGMFQTCLLQIVSRVFLKFSVLLSICKFPEKCETMIFVCGCNNLLI